MRRMIRVVFTRISDHLCTNRTISTATEGCVLAPLRRSRSFTAALRDHFPTTVRASASPSSDRTDFDTDGSFKPHSSAGPTPPQFLEGLENAESDAARIRSQNDG